MVKTEAVVPELLLRVSPGKLVAGATACERRPSLSGEYVEGLLHDSRRVRPGGQCVDLDDCVSQWFSVVQFDPPAVAVVVEDPPDHVRSLQLV